MHHLKHKENFSQAENFSDFKEFMAEFKYSAMDQKVLSIIANISFL